MGYRRDELRFNGWGLRRKTFDLRGRDDEVWAFVKEALGMASLPSTPSMALDDLPMPEVQLEEGVLEKLRGLTAPERVLTDRLERAFHAVGKSYYDLLRIRSGALPGVPDAVVYPESPKEVLDLLAYCAEQPIAVIPFGGGSSVVGGVEAHREAGHAGAVTLDMTRMDRDRKSVV